MEKTEAEAIVRAAYEVVLHRKPGETEFGHWVEYLTGGHSVAELLNAFQKSKEFQALLASIPQRAPGQFHSPPGHFYSPIIDPEATRDYVLRNRARPHAQLMQTIVCNKQMKKFRDANLELMANPGFPLTHDPARRFYVENGNFPLHDAAVLRAMVAVMKPARIIEIGSGFSTACMLDAFDEFGLKTTLTCIDPDLSRVRLIQREQDQSRMTAIEACVQDVPLETFGALAKNDILFIDSSHVMKTGSDVHFELFYILPALQPGVLVHFHDVRYPFEYSDHFLFRQRTSWNEAYALQSYLMFNRAFEIYYWNGMLAALFPDEFPAENPGSSIWLRKTA